MKAALDILWKLSVYHLGLLQELAESTTADSKSSQATTRACDESQIKMGEVSSKTGVLAYKGTPHVTVYMCSTV